MKHNEKLYLVQVLPYDKNWPIKFSEEKYIIESILNSELIYIEHIGSSSIPNLCAKPVIDILISVN
jgi:GrpB-like predicted nucleotidyltransferase (UPF0157 family)